MHKLLEYLSRECLSSKAQSGHKETWQGLNSKTSRQEKGSGGTKCLVSDIQVMEVGTREQTESRHVSLAPTTHSPMLAYQGGVRERMQSYIEKTGQAISGGGGSQEAGR